MRTTKLLPILATILAAGLLVLATTTSNAAVAQTSTSSGTSAQSIIGQINAQYGKCVSGTTTDTSGNLAASNTNLGNAVSAAVPKLDPSGSSALSAIGQANQQSAFTLSGRATTNSGNLAASNTNLGYTVSTAGLP
jgi:hypothetical protein